MSVAVTLLVVSALVAQSVRAVLHADLGYDPAGLLTAEIDVPESDIAFVRVGAPVVRTVLKRGVVVAGAAT